MSVTVIRSAFASAQPETVKLSQILSITNDGANPAYLIVSGLDRNEYTASSTGATGTLAGNGATATFSAIGGDERGVGVVFTWDAATGTYQNATYGNLLDLAYTTSASANDLTDLSFFGTNSSAWLGYARDSATMAVNPQIWTNLGTASFATQPIGAPPASSQATPGQVCSVAMRFVGDTWNMDGCWVLASTIDAEAGAALNVASDSAGTAGAGNGEWKVAYDGTRGANANWQSLIQAGDQVAFITASGGGHITTVVSGAGSSAMVVDNADFGINMVADGTGRDLTIMGPHAAWQEFNGVNAADVVVYRLDTPTITLKAAADAASYGQSQAFSSLFAAGDWASTGITAYQAYDTSGADSIAVNGVACTTAHAAGTAAACASLAGLSFLAGTTTTSDTIEVRAQNAAGYWGDWQALTVGVAAGAVATAPPVPDAPVLARQTAAQTVTGAMAFAFSVPAGTFTDPLGEALTYTATGANGAALPGWLSFNARTLTFSGTAPAASATPAGIVLTATDTSGGKASETIAVTVKAPPAPVFKAGTLSASVYSGQAVSIAAGSFTDPSHLALTLTATLSNGQALPSWLRFNANTGTLTGTAPAAAGTTTVRLTATDAGGASASAVVTIVDKGVDTPVAATRSAAATAYQGHAFAFALPGTAFSDPLKETLTLTATQANGQALPSWLSFNASRGVLSGTAPMVAGAAVSVKVTATNTAGASASEIITIAETRDTPVLAHPTAAPSWTAGQAVRLAIPANTFTDPLGEHLTYAVTRANGQALPSGLAWNAATGTLSGTCPITPGTLGLRVTATNGDGVSASELVSPLIKAAAPGGASWTGLQFLVDGHLVSVPLGAAFAELAQLAAMSAAAGQSGAGAAFGLPFGGLAAEAGLLTWIAPATGRVGGYVPAAGAYAAAFGIPGGASVTLGLVPLHG